MARAMATLKVATVRTPVGEDGIWIAENKSADEHDRRVAAIVDALDAETLDQLEALWRRQKGILSRGGQRTGEPLDWQPGKLLYWDNVFELDRPEAFADEGRLVVALDMYCVNPSATARRRPWPSAKKSCPIDQSLAILAS
jgi:hypothetical protein